MSVDGSRPERPALERNALDMTLQLCRWNSLLNIAKESCLALKWASLISKDNKKSLSKPWKYEAVDLLKGNLVFRFMPGSSQAFEDLHGS